MPMFVQMHVEYCFTTYLDWQVHNTLHFIDQVVLGVFIDVKLAGLGLVDGLVVKESRKHAEFIVGQEYSEEIAAVSVQLLG